MRTVAGALQRRILSGMDPADAWNDLSVDLVRCAKVKVSGYLVLNSLLRSLCLVSSRITLSPLVGDRAYTPY